MGSLKLTTASSGSVILSPANTASDVTITVPAVTGTMLTNKTAGTVLQVVQASYGTVTDTSSATFVASNLTASITPQFSTSKILILVSFPATIKVSTRQITYTLYRNSTNLAPNNGGQLGYGQIYSDSGNLQAICSMNVLDSPSTTSSTTYTMYFSSTNGGAVQIFNNYLTGTITLMEIAA